MSGPPLPEPPEGRLGENKDMILIPPVKGGPCESVGCGGTLVTPEQAQEILGPTWQQLIEESNG